MLRTEHVPNLLTHDFECLGVVTFGCSPRFLRTELLYTLSLSVAGHPHASNCLTPQHRGGCRWPCSSPSMSRSPNDRSTPTDVPLPQQRPPDHTRQRKATTPRSRYQAPRRRTQKDGCAWSPCEQIAFEIARGCGVVELAASRRSRV